MLVFVNEKESKIIAPRNFIIGINKHDGTVTSKEFFRLYIELENGTVISLKTGDTFNAMQKTLKDILKRLSHLERVQIIGTPNETTLS